MDILDSIEERIGSWRTKSDGKSIIGISIPPGDITIDTRPSGFGVQTGSLSIVGKWRLLISPTPNCPCILHPQLQKLPSVLMAKTCHVPAVTACQLVFMPTCVGERRRVVSPNPN